MVYLGRIFHKLECEFLAALKACRARPTREVVHTLRTTSRRMEALLRVVERRQSGDAEFARKIRKTLRTLKTIRRAAGPVRDLDVQQELLRGLLKTNGKDMPAIYASIFREEAIKLKVKLQYCRVGAAANLFLVIQAKREQANTLLSLLSIYLYGSQWVVSLKDDLAVGEKSGRYLRIGSQKSLHTYRKQMKFDRYIAEMETTAQAKRLAKNLKKILDDIGRWHDWMLLAERAKRTLGKSSAFREELKKERDLALRRAIRSVERWSSRS
ncbi:MAG: CHAD domain-containing protein [Acidobacteriaceae bacterium]